MSLRKCDHVTVTQTADNTYKVDGPAYKLQDSASIVIRCAESGCPFAYNITPIIEWADQQVPTETQMNGAKATGGKPKPKPTTKKRANPLDDLLAARPQVIAADGLDDFLGSTT